MSHAYLSFLAIVSRNIIFHALFSVGTSIYQDVTFWFLSSLYFFTKLFFLGICFKLHVKQVVPLFKSFSLGISFKHLLTVAYEKCSKTWRFFSLCMGSHVREQGTCSSMKGWFSYNLPRDNCRTWKLYTYLQKNVFSRPLCLVF